MIKKDEILCEIFFSDHKLGIITSRTGFINVSQLKNFKNKSNLFIMFKEWYHPPIYKLDIKEIIIYQEKYQININEKDLGLELPSKIKFSAKIS